MQPLRLLLLFAILQRPGSALPSTYRSLLKVQSATSRWVAVFDDMALAEEEALHAPIARGRRAVGERVERYVFLFPIC